jgi:predicted N-acyltransferase
MALKVAITRSIRDTNLRDWGRVCDLDNDFVMSPGLLEALETSLGAGPDCTPLPSGKALFWYLLAYDGDRPVGAACLSEYLLDTMVFADPFSQWFVGNVRRWFPRYLKFRVTFCGLPLSIAGSNVRIAPGAETRDVVLALNEAVEQVARQRRTWLVIYKEPNRKEAETLEPLQSFDYVKAESLPMNCISNKFGSFAAMLGAMRSHYRYKISRSRHKFVSSGLTLTRTVGPAALRALYTPEIHAMYTRVVLKAEHRLEILPREFFLELSERFPRELMLTTISGHGEILAFAWSLNYGAVYRNLFVGVDYERNEETDAYFNLMLEDIRHAMDIPMGEIQMGQTADDFKSRLGCTPDPRYLFIKVTNRFLRWLFRRFESSFLTPVPLPPPRNVFKPEPNQSPCEKCDPNGPLLPVKVPAAGHLLPDSSRIE